MKNSTSVVALIIGLSLTILQLNAQENLPSDPLKNFKHFSEVAISVNGTRVNTNNTVFHTSNGTFNFKKNNYLPTMDAMFNYGWLFKDKMNTAIWSIKTGLHVTSRSANLTNSFGSDLRLSTAYLQIPLQVGFRSPLKYNTVKNNMYRAFEIHAGAYVASPFLQKLDLPNNLDSEGKTLAFNYYRFGFLGEIAFTALDAKGHGHKFGLRVSNDFTGLVKARNTEYQLYPFYSSIGLFYTLSNRYK